MKHCDCDDKHYGEQIIPQPPSEFNELPPMDCPSQSKVDDAIDSYLDNVGNGVAILAIPFVIVFLFCFFQSLYHYIFWGNFLNKIT